MFTQLVIYSTVGLLIYNGLKIFQKSREIKYFPGKIFSLGLFLVGTGIFLYAVRDIFVQFEMYKIGGELLIKVGGFLHVLGCILLIWFIVSQFSPGHLKKVFSILGCLIVFIGIVIYVSLPLKSELIQAPFEPFPYKVIRNFPEPKAANLTVITAIITACVSLFGIVLYNALKLEEKKLKKKALFYGLGFLLLFGPIYLCVFVSPIYARWGYLIGAILIHKALEIK